jgi:hypothetical protein
MQDWMQNWGVLGAAAIVLGIVLFSIGCRGVLYDEEAPLLVEEVFTDVSPQGGVMSTEKADLGAVQVYVDRTLSMRPFAAAGSSPYAALLRGLDDLLYSDSQFYGFGYPTDDGGQVVRPADPVLLETPAQYTFVNNDYGPLFSELETGKTHLVVSDGVQSEPRQGERFGEIVTSIGRWIEQGGIFTLIVFRAPYDGPYYHEVPTVGTVNYRCDDRPFYAFGFFPSVAAKTELLDILEDGGVSPFYTLTVGEVSAAVRAQENAPPKDSTVPRGPSLLTSFEKHGDSSPKIHHVYSGRPATKIGTVSPLRFTVAFDSTRTLWSRLTASGRERVARSLEPSFRHWRIDTLSVPSKTASLTRLSAPELVDPTARPGESSWTAQLKTPLSFTPPELTRIASLLTIGLSPAGANSLVPDALSTRRDDRPAACSRTLNIQPMMGVVLREHYVLGRALLVTEWM